MLRRLYALLIRLHPRSFRERFGEEMLEIFDESANDRNRGELFADAVASVLRQRLLRDQDDHVVAAVRPSGSGVPLFAAVNTSRPRSQVLTQGALITLLAWSALSFAISAGAERRSPRFELSGVHLLVDSRLRPTRVNVRGGGPSVPAAARVRRNGPDVTVEGATPSVWVKMLSVFGFAAVEELPATALSPMPARPGAVSGTPSPRLRLAPPPPPDLLFASIDANFDSVLSDAEIASAPRSLLRLDRNHDGRLSAEECGLSPVLTRTAGRMPRLFAALDRDGDGELSAAEIAGAAVALRKLYNRRSR